MKACGLVGSPINGGNVDRLVDRVLQGASSRGAIAGKLCLNDLSIQPCQSCGPRAQAGFCRFEDDMQQVYVALKESDIIVLGSPVYFDTVSAQTKLMIDRCNCLTALVGAGEGTLRFEQYPTSRKAGILVAVGGVGQDFGPIRETVAGFFAWVNADFVASILYAHDDNERGGVRMNREWMRRAFNAGVRIVTRAAARNPGSGA